MEKREKQIKSARTSLLIQELELLPIKDGWMDVGMSPFVRLWDLGL